MPDPRVKDGMRPLDATPKSLLPIEQHVIGNKLSELSAEFFYADREKYGNKSAATILDEIEGVIADIKQAFHIDDDDDFDLSDLFDDDCEPGCGCDDCYDPLGSEQSLYASGNQEFDQ